MTGRGACGCGLHTANVGHAPLHHPVRDGESNGFKRLDPENGSEQILGLLATYLPRYSATCRFCQHGWLRLRDWLAVEPSNLYDDGSFLPLNK